MVHILGMGVRSELVGVHLSLLLSSLGGGFGNLTRASLSLQHTLDYSYGDGLSHVTDSETTEGSVVGESLDAHGLLGHHLDDGGISRLDVSWVVLELLARTTIDLLDDIPELAGDVRGVAIHDRCVSGLDLSGVVKDDNLGFEFHGLLGGVVLAVGAYVSTTDVLDGNVLYVESDVVSGESLIESGVVHLDRLNLSGDGSGGEADNHAWLEHTGLNTTDGHCSNTSDLVYVRDS